MAELLDADLLKQNEVNPFAAEIHRIIPVLSWIVDPQTQRPVAYWRLQVKPAPTLPR